MVSLGPPRPAHQARRRLIKDLDEATPVQAAALGDIIAGFSNNHVAKKYGIANTTVKQWIRDFDIHRALPPVGSRKPIPDNSTVVLARGAYAEIPTERIPNPSYSVVGPDQRPKPMGEQLLDYLQANLEALNRQLAIAGDQDWLRKQNAADLAALHRVIADRFFTLANAAMEGQKQGESEDN